MGTPAIRLTGVDKQYVKYDDAPTLLGHALKVRRRTRRSRIWAVRDVDLEVEAGTSLGVIGRNGSGKSTLLRLLAGVTAPTEGTVRVVGWVAPMIAVGVGFHPELTGRENVYVHGAVLGLSRRQVEERFDEVLAFAELEGFADTPVKFYSSGMFLRLGFAASVMAEPDVLLVDEVLAVGDLGFQAKCFERMTALRDAGTTVVVVSHNLPAIHALCPRAVLLDGGRVLYDGDTGETIARYHAVLRSALDIGPDGRPVGELADVSVVVEEFSFVVRGSGTDGHPRSGDEVDVRVALRCERPVDAMVVEIGILNDVGQWVYRETVDAGDGAGWAAGEQAAMTGRMRLNLGSGSYAACAWVRTPGGELIAQPPQPAVFFVVGRDRAQGVSDLASSLSLSRPGRRPPRPGEAR